MYKSLWGISIILYFAAVPLYAEQQGRTQYGIASFYAEKFHGRQTASGEIYNMNDLSAAHPSLPFDTVVEVENLDNGRKVRVYINDRGPFVEGRIIDVSKRAAENLGMLKAGLARVKVTVIGRVKR